MIRASTLTPIEEGSENSSPGDAKSNESRVEHIHGNCSQMSWPKEHLPLRDTMSLVASKKERRFSKSQSPVRPRPGPKSKAHVRAKSLGRSFSSELAQKVKGSGDFGKMLAKRATEVTQKSPQMPAKDSEIPLGGRQCK